LSIGGFDCPKEKPNKERYPHIFSRLSSFGCCSLYSQTFNLKVGQYHLSVIQACVLNGLASTEKSCYYEMNSWIHSRRRISTLISCSGEPERIVFFKDLHQQLDEF
jgi:hypothetical protein